MLNSIYKWKIWGALAVAFTLMLTYIKKLKADKRELEHEAKVEGKIKENAKKQTEDEREVLNNEPIEIKAEREKRAELTKKARFNRL